MQFLYTCFSYSLTTTTGAVATATATKVIKVSLFLAHTCVTSIVNEIQWVCCCLTPQYQKRENRSGEEMNMNCYACFICVHAYVCVLVCVCQRVCTHFGEIDVQKWNQARSANITHPSNKLYFCAINGRWQKASFGSLFESLDRSFSVTLLNDAIACACLPPRFNRRVSISNVFIHTDSQPHAHSETNT